MQHVLSDVVDTTVACVTSCRWSDAIDPSNRVAICACAGTDGECALSCLFRKKIGCQGADFWVDCCLAADAMFGELWYVSRCTAVFRVLQKGFRTRLSNCPSGTSSVHTSRQTKRQQAKASVIVANRHSRGCSLRNRGTYILTTTPCGQHRVAVPPVPRLAATKR